MLSNCHDSTKFKGLILKNCICPAHSFFLHQKSSRFQGKSFSCFLFQVSVLCILADARKSCEYLKVDKTDLGQRKKKRNVESKPTRPHQWRIALRDELTLFGRSVFISEGNVFGSTAEHHAEIRKRFESQHISRGLPPRLWAAYPQWNAAAPSHATLSDLLNQSAGSAKVLRTRPSHQLYRGNISCKSKIQTFLSLRHVIEFWTKL